MTLSVSEHGVLMGRKVKERDTPLGRYIRTFIDRHYDGNVERVAERSGMSDTTIYAWMRGAIIDQRVSNLKRVADALGAPFEDLCRVAVELAPRYDNPARAAQIERVTGLLSNLTDAELERATNQIEHDFPRDHKRVRAPVVRVPVPKPYGP